MDILDYTIGSGGLPTDSEIGIAAGGAAAAATATATATAPKPNLRIRTPKEDYDDYDSDEDDLEKGLHEKDWMTRKAAIAISNADASNISPYFTVPVILLYLYVTFFAESRIEGR